MTGIEHFLLTRFAVRIREAASAPDPTWISARVEIFKAVCLPSVLAQTSKDFRWLVFLDSDVSQDLVSELEAILPSNGEIIRVEGVCARDAIAAAVQSRTSGEKVITSRVDNDDALHPTYIAKVRASLEPLDLSFVNFTRGYQYSRRRLLNYAHPSNAFISLVEPVGREMLITVFADWHTRLRNYGPIVQVKAGRMWVQNCHGGNVKNQERGLRANLVRGAASFPFLDLKHQSPVEFTVDYIATAVNIMSAVLRKPAALMRLVGRS